MEPFAPATDTEITDAAFDARVDRRDVNGIAAAGPAGTIGGEPICIDVRPRFEIAKGTPDVFRLPLRHHPAALFAFAVPPTSVVEAQTSVSNGAELFEHHDVVLGVLEAEKARALNDARVWLCLLRVGQVEHACELDAFAVEIHFLRTHKNSRIQSLHSVQSLRSVQFVQAVEARLSKTV